MIEVCFIAVNENRTRWSLSTPGKAYQHKYKEDMEVLLMQKGVPQEISAEYMARAESNKQLGFMIRS